MNPVPNPGLLTARVAATIDDVARFVPDATRLRALHAHLVSPVRVALVGRVNAGKSTLLNALVGLRVAPTNEVECTRVATWYRFGAPARIDVVGLDKCFTTIPLVNRLPDELDRPLAEVDFIAAYVPSAVLRTYELIDTPGLAAMTSTTAATRRAVVNTTAGVGIPRPDVTLFLSDGSPKADEIEFLRDMGATRIDTLALLSHADKFGDGAFADDDPIEAAARHAATLRSTLVKVAGNVIPVSGLLAQTAFTGHLQESDARAMRDLADDDPDYLESVLAGEETHPKVSADHIERLLRLVDAYGVVNGRQHASGATELGQWLGEASGLTAVRDEITNRYLPRSEVIKARHVFAELQSIASTSPQRAAILSILESAQMDPALHRLREANALELIIKWDANHPLVKRLDDLTAATSISQRLGLPKETDPATLQEVAQRECENCHRERVAALSAAEREAWTVLERSYQLIYRPPPPPRPRSTRPNR
ncbi:MAG: GTPase [Mycobacterium sp.]